MASRDAYHAMEGDETMTIENHQEPLSIGFGCSSRASSEDIVRLIQTSLAPIPPGTTIATLDRRASIGETVAAALGLRLVLLPASVLAHVPGVTAHSSLAFVKTQTANVAEASALASLGPSAHLIIPQQKGRFCTCAVAALPPMVRP